jgi:hypothetical protein
VGGSAHKLLKEFLLTEKLQELEAERHTVTTFSTESLY